MSAFLPESDSEDELPPGWEERATLQGEVNSIPLYPNLAVYYLTNDRLYYRFITQITTNLPPNGNTQEQGGGKQLAKTCHLVGREELWRTTRFLSFFQMDRFLFHFKQVVYVDLVNKKTTFTDPRLAFAKETVSASTTFRQKFDSGSTALQVFESKHISGKWRFPARWPMGETSQARWP